MTYPCSVLEYRTSQDQVLSPCISRLANFYDWLSTTDITLISPHGGRTSTPGITREQPLALSLLHCAGTRCCEVALTSTKTAAAAGIRVMPSCEGTLNRHRWIGPCTTGFMSYRIESIKTHSIVSLNNIRQGFPPAQT